MSQDTPTSEQSIPDPSPPLEAETLIGRLVDREATGEDRLRFERLAEGERDLWKNLALRQLDMAMLSDGVCAVTAAADRVDFGTAAPPRWHAGLALSGWAAAILLGLWWAAGGGPRAAPGPGAQPAAQPAPAVTMSPREHLRQYLASGFVVGEDDPILLEQQDLGDGRHQIWFVRRIEETAIIDQPLDGLIGDSGKFLKDPADLRRP